MSQCPYRYISGFQTPEWSVKRVGSQNLQESFLAGSYSFAKACITFERMRTRSVARLNLLLSLPMRRASFRVQPFCTELMEHGREAPRGRVQMCLLQVRPPDADRVDHGAHRVPRLLDQPAPGEAAMCVAVQSCAVRRGALRCDAMRCDARTRAPRASAWRSPASSSWPTTTARSVVRTQSLSPARPPACRGSHAHDHWRWPQTPRPPRCRAPRVPYPHSTAQCRNVALPRPMICRAVLCYAMLCHAMLCDAMP